MLLLKSSICLLLKLKACSFFGFGPVKPPGAVYDTFNIISSIIPSITSKRPFIPPNQSSNSSPKTAGSVGKFLLYFNPKYILGVFITNLLSLLLLVSKCILPLVLNPIALSENKRIDHF